MVAQQEQNVSTMVRSSEGSPSLIPSSIQIVGMTYYDTPNNNTSSVLDGIKREYNDESATTNAALLHVADDSKTAVVAKTPNNDTSLDDISPTVSVDQCISPTPILPMLLPRPIVSTANANLIQPVATASPTTLDVCKTATCQQLHIQLLLKQQQLNQALKLKQEPYQERQSSAMMPVVSNDTAMPVPIAPAVSNATTMPVPIAPTASNAITGERSVCDDQQQQQQPLVSSVMTTATTNTKNTKKYNIVNAVAPGCAGGGGHILQFPWKLHEMLRVAEKTGKSDVISWLPDGSNGFKVHHKERFCSEIMPGYFASQKYKTFQRSLNLWGFESVSKGPEKGACYHRFFVKGHPEFCHNMKRVKIKGGRGLQPLQREDALALAKTSANLISEGSVVKGVSLSPSSSAFRTPAVNLKNIKPPIMEGGKGTSGVQSKNIDVSIVPTVTNYNTTIQNLYILQQMNPGMYTASMSDNTAINSLVASQLLEAAAAPSSQLITINGMLNSNFPTTAAASTFANMPLQIAPAPIVPNFGGFQNWTNPIAPLHSTAHQFQHQQQTIDQKTLLQQLRPTSISIPQFSSWIVPLSSADSVTAATAIGANKTSREEKNVASRVMGQND